MEFKIKKDLLFCLLVIFAFVLLTPFVFAEDINSTDKQKVIQCIYESRSLMNILENEQFSTLRIDNIIKEAETILQVQEALVKAGRNEDYSRIFFLCNEVSNLKILAFQLKDEIKVLRDFYGESSKGIDTEGIELLFLEIEKEMTNERYELVHGLIERTYSEIILAQSQATTLNVFYDVTTKGLKRFFIDRWKEFSIGAVAFILLILLLKKPVEKARLRRAIREIEIRRQSLKEMITENQDLYFNKGKISEESFTIKNKKLAEIIRDVDRQISILREQLYALDNRKKVRRDIKNKNAKTNFKDKGRKERFLRE